jgi:hypothetical protein
LEHTALRYIERVLGDAYRKQIDREENVWRSLPFFAATQVPELAALFQFDTRLPPLGTHAGCMAVASLILTGFF